MSDTKDFLFEIGSEELPPKALKKLASSLRDGMADGLKKASLAYNTIEFLAAPRRLAVRVTDLVVQQADQAIERRGPAKSAAFDDQGNPTKACEGFAKSCGVSVADLQEEETAKGTWLVFRSQRKGRLTIDLLADIAIRATSQLPIPKPMRWGDYETQFIRPVHWIVMLFGDDVVPCTILGKPSGRDSVGHRFHHPGRVSIQNAGEYESALEKAFVLVAYDKRQEKIKNEVSALAESKNLVAHIEAGLLDEVTGLVEWPVPLMVEFDKQFLRVPSEALVAAMRDHQKCFDVQDSNGELQPYFITVSNIESTDPAQVIKGNERVMCARLSDAAFFYETDLKQGLDSFLPQLKNVTFQAKLGSLYDKTVRIATLAHALATDMGIDAGMAERAGMLSKCDLVSDMVGEFPYLQGTMGKYYARQDKEPDAIALALEEAYFPRSATDALPSTKLAASLAIADRLDTLVGIFGIGQIPTGVKDPFACRRAALGIIRICLHHQLDIDLADYIHKARQSYGDIIEDDTVEQSVHQFILERLKVLFQDKDIPADAIASVLARQSSRLIDFQQRLDAVMQFRQLAEAEALAAANKRVSRLLQKENKLELKESVEETLLQDPAEKALADCLERMEKQVQPLCDDRKYTEALSELAGMREPVDKFFDDVMVMVDEEALRNNRLALLAKLRFLFLQVADISLLQ